MDDAIETPAFVIDEDRLARQVSQFRTAMQATWPSGIISYSVKTNPLPWLVAWMARHGVWAEVVSDHEYRLAVEMGHHPSRIVFNGPTKSREAMRSALGAGSIVNLDSRREVRWITELAASSAPHSIAVGLRVNWDVSADCPGQIGTEAIGGPRFGFDAGNGDLDEVLTRLRDCGVRISGLHFHVSSLTRSPEVYASATMAARAILARHELTVDYLDLGGGFYGGDDPAFPAPGDYLEVIEDNLAGAVDPATTRLIIEPGAAFIAAPVEFHTTVLDAKPAGSQRIVVTDGSRINIDPLFRKTGHQHVLRSAGPPCEDPQVVCGFTCMDDDRLITLTEAPLLTEGDSIIYTSVGSYTMCFNSPFIELPPAVYVRRSSGELALVRRAGRMEDFLAGNDWSSQPVRSRP